VKNLQSPLIFFSVVVSWFWRRSGSRVSIPNACRRTSVADTQPPRYPYAPSDNPEKALGHEPQIDPWVDTVQPGRLQSLRNRSASSLLRKKMKLRRWNNARTKPNQAKPNQAKPSALPNGQGLEVAKSFSTSGRGRNFSLDIPLYRSGVYTCNRWVTSLMAMFQQLPIPTRS
jgi:hypothetical protein